MLKRFLKLELPENQSLFLWGARKTGKSTFLKELYPQSIYINLLENDTLLSYIKNPSRLRHEILEYKADILQYPIIIDEIQKVPALLDEVHWLIENEKDRGVYFILCGSSLRRLKLSGSNLLGGRAWRQIFMPLCYPELPEFDLLRILNQGLIPSHYLTQKDYERLLQGYLADYLIPEIQWESRIRQIGSFSRFLDAIAYSNGSMVSWNNIARECSVNSRTVQSYVELLIDMLLGYLIFPYSKGQSRAMISATPKFYFFDTGLISVLRNTTVSTLKGAEAGSRLEHYIFLELMAYKNLNNLLFPIEYWRTKSGYEVDFILDRGKVAIEVKISENVHISDLKALRAFAHDNEGTTCFLVSMEQRARKIEVGNSYITILPVEEFLKRLWNNEII